MFFKLELFCHLVTVLNTFGFYKFTSEKCVGNRFCPSPEKRIIMFSLKSIRASFPCKSRHSIWPTCCNEGVCYLVQMIFMTCIILPIFNQLKKKMDTFKFLPAHVLNTFKHACSIDLKQIEKKKVGVSAVVQNMKSSVPNCIIC